MRITHLLPITLLLWTTSTLAASPIDETRPLRADADVEIENVSGTVEVRGWDRNEISITGTLGEGAKPLQITGDESQLSIEVEAQDSGGWFNWGDADMEPTVLHVRVPRGVDLSVDVVSATASIGGLDGGEISVDSVSGNVRIDAQSPLIEVDSVSADVALSGAAEAVDIETVSGDIHVPRVRTEASAESVSGDIHVQGGPFELIEASTVSGDVSLAGALAENGRMEVESMSGDIELALAANVSAVLDAETFSGNITSGVGDASSPAHGAGSNLHTTLGAGHGDIALETFSGDIEISTEQTARAH